MKREINFRAKGDRGWSYSKNCELDFWYGLSDGQLSWESLGQFTGLKDKNGKDIYEGDIIKDRYWTSHLGRREVDWLEYYTRAVEWLDCGGWNVQVPSISYRPHLEVVGNIHDNPELLKQ